ncbi:FAD-binding oxidoreductase [Microbulbifer sp. ZKSA006]|uniref:FAD-binding oxidoreductase n=1 Tax=Microbulbifer sp. ZKSA006 TaxID=3243390 RepID=UPI0040391BD1
MYRGLFIIVLLAAEVSAREIAPFSTDGCSVFPNGTVEQRELWLDCCTAHDYAYWKGGTYGERKRADKDLALCVAATGEEEIARMMLMGVRVGGTPFLPTPFRWGYGWPYLRGYKALSAAELKVIRQSEGAPIAD